MLAFGHFRDNGTVLNLLHVGQGRMLSPILFNVCMDELSMQLMLDKQLLSSASLLSPCECR